MLAAVAIAVGLLWRREAAERQVAERQARLSGDESHRQTEALRAELAWAKSAAGTSDDLMLVCDRRLFLRYTNLAAEARFGAGPPGTRRLAYTGGLGGRRLD